MDVDHLHGFSSALLSWYEATARQLPWRSPPAAGRPDAYRVWLAEIMAQQTRAAVAGRYWQQFLCRWPDVEALAAASEEEVCRAWAGLGYYARARNLLKAARAITARGGFPTTAAGWRTLSGIGDYTAAAIAAIAFGEPVVALDGNVRRVAARLFAEPADTPAGLRRLREQLRAHIPPGRAGDFSQALMDLGATLCTPKGPDCRHCPLAAFCLSHQTATTDRYPAPAQRSARPRRHGLVWWIEDEGAVALTRRPSRGLLGGMVALPGGSWGSEAPDILQPDTLPFRADWQPLPGTVRHVFTHFELTLAVVRTRTAGRPPAAGGQDLFYVRRDQLATAGLPSLYQKVVALVAGAGVPGDDNSTSSTAGRLRLISRSASFSGIGRPK